MEKINIGYSFKFEAGGQIDYSIIIDRKNGTIILPEDSKSPDWTKLESNKCSNCTLDMKEYPYCPVAKNLNLIVEGAKEKISFTKTHVTVETTERTHSKDTDLQTGLFSLMGLLMASSDCPHFKFLAPMARFHLPFSTVYETLLRSCSLYLLSKHFENDESIHSLESLKEHYEQLSHVNLGMMERIKNTSKGDADPNAITTLNVFASMFEMEFMNDWGILKEYYFPQGN